jgi:mannose-1-phosphate guanylyltransferase / phosphomannomutase
VVETRPNALVALPVSSSSAAEAICAAHGAVIVPTKLSSAHIMEVAASEGMTFAASQSGGYIFPEILPAYDAAAALVELVAMLGTTGHTLSKLVRSLPPIHIAHDAVVTPWEQKGLLMRTLVEQLGDRPLVLVDGVKAVEEDGWALVLPDPEEALTHIWAEAPSELRARSRAQQYAVRLRQLLR